MTMKYTWQETGARRMAIQYRPGLMQRLFGLPFMAVGIFLVRELVQEGATGVEGVVLLLFSVVFFLAGWNISFRSFSYQINAGDHYIEHVTSFVLWRKSREISTDAIKKISTKNRVIRVGQKHGGRSASYIQVVLLDDNGQSLISLPFGRDARTAEAVGRKIAEIMAVPYEFALPATAEMSRLRST